MVNAYDALRLKDQHLKPYLSGIVNLGDHFIKFDGKIDLFFTVEGVDVRVVNAEFVVLKDSTAYNVILRKKTINDSYKFISTKFSVKLLTSEGRVATIRGD
uniref:Uncharacterized protein n=1 Tax=Arachis duranensis TaxID=130453 RepID=N1NFT7_ARADU|nr:hypothetical protein ARAX_ADH18B08-022 [Arachis duranensis]